MALFWKARASLYYLDKCESRSKEPCDRLLASGYPSYGTYLSTLCFRPLKNKFGSCLSFGALIQRCEGFSAENSL